MGKATKVKTPKAAAVGYDEAKLELGGLQGRIRRAADEHRRMTESAAAAGAELRLMRDREKALLKVVDLGPPKEAPRREMVDNPLRADELVAQEIAEGVKQAGRIEVDIRLATRIGGLARLGAHLDEPRLAAAGRFRSAWDGAQVGGAPAIDYSSVRVDVSGSLGSSEAALARVEDAMEVYRQAVRAIGQIKANLVQKVICEEMSLRDLGLRLGRPVGGKATMVLRDEVLEAVDALVEHFRTGPAAGRRRVRGAMDGPRPAMPEQKTVIIYSDAPEVNSEAA